MHCARPVWSKKRTLAICTLAIGLLIFSTILLPLMIKAFKTGKCRFYSVDQSEYYRKLACEVKLVVNGTSKDNPFVVSLYAPIAMKNPLTPMTPQNVTLWDQHLGFINTITSSPTVCYKNMHTGQFTLYTENICDANRYMLWAIFGVTLLLTIISALYTAYTVHDLYVTKHREFLQYQARVIRHGDGEQ